MLKPVVGLQSQRWNSDVEGQRLDGILFLLSFLFGEDTHNLKVTVAIPKQHTGTVCGEFSHTNNLISVHTSFSLNIDELTCGPAPWV